MKERLWSERASCCSGFGDSFLANGAQNGVLLIGFFLGRGEEATFDLRVLAARCDSFFGATCWTLGLAVRATFFGASSGAAGGLGLGGLALRGAAFFGTAASTLGLAVRASFLGALAEATLLLRAVFFGAPSDAAFFGAAIFLPTAGCRFGRFSSMIN